MTLILALICTAVGGLCVGLALAQANARETVGGLARWAARERRHAQTVSRKLADQQAAKARYEQECG